MAYVVGCAYDYLIEKLRSAGYSVRELERMEEIFGHTFSDERVIAVSVDCDIVDLLDCATAREAESVLDRLEQRRKALRE